jgi:hypothetical protein
MWRVQCHYVKLQIDQSILHATTVSINWQLRVTVLQPQYIRSVHLTVVATAATHNSNPKGQFECRQYVSRHFTWLHMWDSMVTLCLYYSAFSIIVFSDVMPYRLVRTVLKHPSGYMMLHHRRQQQASVRISNLKYTLFHSFQILLANKLMSLCILRLKYGEWSLSFISRKKFLCEKWLI